MSTDVPIHPLIVRLFYELPGNHAHRLNSAIHAIFVALTEMTIEVTCRMNLLFPSSDYQSKSRMGRAVRI
jgi:hypothetical protein